MENTSEKKSMIINFSMLFTGNMNTLACKYFSEKYGFMFVEEQVMWKSYFLGFLLNHQPAFWIITGKVMYSNVAMDFRAPLTSQEL